MKKTIAILLVLVIGMAGVFAAVGTADLLLATTVEPIDQMRIAATTETLTISDFPLNDDFTSFTGTAVDLDETDTTNAQAVGKLYTYSNRRVYEVQITASALSSLSGGVTEYINYTVSGGNDGTQATTYTTNGATPVLPVVFYKHAASNGGASIGADGQAISVTLTTDYTDVAAGSYSGAITFNYIAN